MDVQVIKLGCVGGRNQRGATDIDADGYVRTGYGRAIGRCSDHNLGLRLRLRGFSERQRQK